MSTSTTSTTHSVNVTGLATSTSDSHLEHFFSFCGKIESIKHEGAEAKVSFVKESAAKTALMLNGGTLDGSTISVTSQDVTAPSAASAKAPEVHTDKDGHEVEQEDKPHSAIAAEYLAHGYVLTDAAIERAIAADKQYGISSRFLSFFNPVAAKVQGTAQPHIEKVTGKLAEVDASRGISLKANAAAIIGTKYYNAALASPFGAKVHTFYTNTSKQVLDVHEEALRIKESKKNAATQQTAPTAGTGIPTPASSEGKPLQTTAAPLV